METVALADIVINLFVFFFITFGLFATFDAAQKGILPIELPKIKYSSSKKSSEPLAVIITRKGDLYVGGEQILLSKLKESLNQELALRKDKTVTVRADRSISLQKFVSVLELVRSTKAKSVLIEAEATHSPPSGSK